MADIATSLPNKPHPKHLLFTWCAVSLLPPHTQYTFQSSAYCWLFQCGCWSTVSISVRGGTDIHTLAGPASDGHSTSSTLSQLELKAVQLIVHSLAPPSQQVYVWALKASFVSNQKASGLQRGFRPTFTRLPIHITLLHKIIDHNLSLGFHPYSSLLHTSMFI